MNSPANLVPSGLLNPSAHLKLPSSTPGNQVLVTNRSFAYLFISLSWFKSGTFPIGFYSRFVFSLRLYLKTLEFLEGLGLADRVAGLGGFASPLVLATVSTSSRVQQEHSSRAAAATTDATALPCFP